MYKRLYTVLTDFLGDSKQEYIPNDTEQLQFNCPCCADFEGHVDGKYNLEINLKKLKYHCWKCGETDNMRGNVATLVKKYGNTRNYKDFIEAVKQIRITNSFDINFYLGNFYDGNNVEPLRLPKTFKHINIKECKDKKLLDYLNKRCIDQNTIDRFNIGYTNWGEEDKLMRNRIILPSYDEYGELNYWVGRDFTGYHTKMKYKNCDANKKEIIFQESTIDWYADVVLCEGPMDAIRLPNAISLLGKSLSKDSLLYHTLMEKAKGNVIICLDNDTTIDETKKIYKLLNTNNLKDKVYYIRLNFFKDFGELYESMGKRGIIKALSTINKFKEIELL